MQVGDFTVRLFLVALSKHRVVAWHVENPLKLKIREPVLVYLWVNR